jgi:uncharacterized membrane protein
MNTFTIADAFSHGWQKTKQHFWLTAGVLVSYAAISIAIGRVGEMAKENVVLNIIAFMISIALGVAIKIGFTRYFLNADEDKGSYNDLYTMGGVFFTYFVAYVLLSLITVAGLFLLVVPGIIIALIYFFVPTLIIDRGLEVGEAFKESAAMTKGHRLHLLGFALVSVLLNFVGVLVVVVGLLVTVPVTCFGGVYIYRKLLGAEMPVVIPEQSNPEA